MVEIGISSKIDFVVDDCFYVAFWWQGDSV